MASDKAKGAPLIDLQKLPEGMFRHSVCRKGP